ncbi:MAG: MqnA/MqnD/SBP family protein [Fimbriimonadales bacterium]
MSTSLQTIRVGHSPDADDAFMFWGLANNIIETRFQFEHILRDIQTLNEWAMEGRLETTAVSVHALAHVSDKYAVLRHGGSFGEDYGPMLVSSREMSVDELRDQTIAIPGLLTSAFLQLNLFLPKPKYEVVPFDEIVPAIKEGKFDVGLIIHESQLTWEQEGLFLVADFGKWWKAETGLPLPLGVNVVRKDLGADAIRDINRAMRESIRAGLANREKALEYALQFGRGVSKETGDEFVGMYVNERTLDMGSDGKRAIELLLERGAEAGLLQPVSLEFIEETD